MIAVPNDAIMTAQQQVYKCLGFMPCDAAAAAYAGLVEAVRSGAVDPEHEVLLHLTGGGFAELSNDGLSYQPVSLRTGRGEYDAALGAIEQYLASAHSETCTVK
jgi:threonine synthase